MLPVTPRPCLRHLPWLAALLLCWMAGAALAQQAADPPARVAHLSYHEGSVVFAPQGDDEWIDLSPNRPLTLGDRLWTDRGARAELQVGTGTLHVDSESHLGISALDDQAAQFILQQGTVSERVRDLVTGENFEIDTPNVAVRALATGDYRVDVAADGSQTRVTVNDGEVSVFGERGQSIQMTGGQQATFTGRQLAQLRVPTLRQDEFDLWAAERNRAEDESRSARFVPRGVIGYDDLDGYGQWAQDPDYGAVWFPTVTVADWAPYRYGRWDWIAPWGWTWVDNAPWGFAPFHYGRWTMIGHRWAWVPGRMPTRPAYAPALVVFLGAGPEVGWYPLAPGEAWYPTYRASPRYVTRLNFNVDVNRGRFEQRHFWREHPAAVTVVRDEDFRRGRPVHQHWEPLRPGLLDQARVGVVPPRPATRPERERVQPNQPRVQAQPPTSQPAMPSRFWGGPQHEQPAMRDTRRAPEQQQRIQRAQGEADRIIRQQQLEQEVQRRQQGQQDWARRQQEQRIQQDASRRQQESRVQQDALRRQQEQRIQQDAQRQQQLRLQQDALRQQQELRLQQDALRQQQERAQREAWQRQQQEQAARVQQERAVHEAWQRQQQQRGDAVMQPPQSLDAMRQQHERAAREALQRERQMAAPPRPQEPRREAEGRGGEPRWQRDADEAPGFGRGGRWQRNG